MLLLPSQAAPWLKVAKRQGVASFLPFLEAVALEITQSLSWGMKIILLAWLNAWGDVLTAGCHFSTNNRQFFSLKYLWTWGFCTSQDPVKLPCAASAGIFFSEQNCSPCSSPLARFWSCSCGAAPQHPGTQKELSWEEAAAADSQSPAQGQSKAEDPGELCSLALHLLFEEKTVLPEAASLSPFISAKYVSIKKWNVQAEDNCRL